MDDDPSEDPFECPFEGYPFVKLRGLPESETRALPSLPEIVSQHQVTHRSGLQAPSGSVGLMKSSTVP